MTNKLYKKIKKILCEDTFFVIMLILFIFILILFLLPFLKEFYPTSIIFQELDYPIIIISGIIGVYFLLINLIIKYYKSDNKNQILKDTIPILMLFLYMQ